MRSRVLRTRLTQEVILRMFSPTVTARWDRNVVSIHYLSHGEEIYCCVEGDWRKVNYHWERFDRGEEGWQSLVEIDSISKVDLPKNMVYSHTGVVDRDLPEGDFFREHYGNDEIFYYLISDAGIQSNQLGLGSRW